VSGRGAVPSPTRGTLRCDLSEEQRVRLRNRLDEEIDLREGQVILLEFGPSRRGVVDEIEARARPKTLDLPAATVL